ncbi:hypothetical protein ACAG26_24190 [Mycobacterium sp. pUA109]|uniref:hypothetical protein n=1 Tax=Mycobacterium sp. pUA109 TaxID=3238982 RepID=UPI00351BDA88
MKLRRIWSPSDARKLADHARKFAGLKVVKAHTDARTEDDLEFERDLEYLRDLETAVMAEARSVVPRQPRHAIAIALLRLDGLAGNSDMDIIADLDHAMAEFKAVIS